MLANQGRALTEQDRALLLAARRAAAAEETPFMTRPALYAVRGSCAAGLCAGYVCCIHLNVFFWLCVRVAVCMYVRVCVCVLGVHGNVLTPAYSWLPAW